MNKSELKNLIKEVNRELLKEEFDWNNLPEDYPKPLNVKLKKIKFKDINIGDEISDGYNEAWSLLKITSLTPVTGVVSMVCKVTADQLKKYPGRGLDAKIGHKEVLDAPPNSGVFIKI